MNYVALALAVVKLAYCRWRSESFPPWTCPKCLLLEFVLNVLLYSSWILYSWTRPRRSPLILVLNALLLNWTHPECSPLVLFPNAFHICFCTKCSSSVLLPNFFHICSRTSECFPVLVLEALLLCSPWMFPIFALILLLQRGFIVHTLLVYSFYGVGCY